MRIDSVPQAAPGEWKRVVMHQKDDRGIPKFNSSGDLKKYTYLMHVPSGDFYLDEEKSIVAAKSALVALGTPFYTLGCMLWYSGRIFYDIPAIALKTLKQFGEAVWRQKEIVQPFINSVRNFTIGIRDQVFAKDLWKLVRLPLFSIGMFVMALYGIVSPYEGHRYEAMIEHSLQDRVSYKEDYRQKLPEYRPGCVSESVATAQGIYNAEAFYLAYCFQVRGNYNDKKFNFVRELPSR